MKMQDYEKRKEYTEAKIEKKVKDYVASDKTIKFFGAVIGACLVVGAIGVVVLFVSVIIALWHYIGG